MKIRFLQKSKSILVSPREAQLIAAAEAEAEAAGNRELSLDNQDNVPPTALEPLIAKRNGKGFKNLTFQGNLYETRFIDDINERFAQAELTDKRKSK
jgi:hypothetical protein